MLMSFSVFRPIGIHDASVCDFRGISLLGNTHTWRSASGVDVGTSHISNGYRMDQRYWMDRWYRKFDGIEDIDCFEEIDGIEGIDAIERSTVLTFVTYRISRYHKESVYNLCKYRDTLIYRVSNQHKLHPKYRLLNSLYEPILWQLPWLE